MAFPGTGQHDFYCQDEECSVTHGPSIYLRCPVIDISPISRAAPPASSIIDTDLEETDCGRKWQSIELSQNRKDFFKLLINRCG